MITLIEAQPGAPPASAHEGNPACGSPNLPQDRPEGLLISPENSSAQYLIEGCAKRLFTNATDLATHRFQHGFVEVSTEEASSIGNGATIRAREGTVFDAAGTKHIIDVSGSTYYKRQISPTAWTNYFGNCGYTTAHIVYVSSSFMSSNYPNNGPAVTPSTPRPDGQLIVWGPLYLFESGATEVKRPFYSTAAKDSYSFIQPACADSSSYDTGATLKARQGTRFKSSSSTAQYMVETTAGGYFKRHLTGGGLAFYQLDDVGSVLTWSSSEVSAYPDIDHVHPVKSLFVDNWYKSPVSNSLIFDRQYNVGQAEWEANIAYAVGLWNQADTALDLHELPYSTNNDVHIKVVDLSEFPYRGWVYFYDTTSDGSLCNPNIELPPDCQGTAFRRADVRLNHPLVPNDPEYRKGIAGHEIGHALSLAHDGLSGGGGDGECGGLRVPTSIMDYDCYGTSGPLLSPADWDVCGFNHKYYSASYGWSGC